MLVLLYKLKSVITGKRYIGNTPDDIKIDQTIERNIFTSYYSNYTLTPLFISYKLYKAGGLNSRKSLSFKSNGIFPSANKKDYEKSGYDIGHMADAEDFSNDLKNETETFSFYNAQPQTEKMNRGCWKVLEGYTRKKSINEHLLIICGGIDFLTKIKNVSIPNYCFKIIKSIDSNTIKSYIFSNDLSDNYNGIELNELLDKMPKYKDIINNIILTNDIKYSFYIEKKQNIFQKIFERFMINFRNI